MLSSSSKTSTASAHSINIPILWLGMGTGSQSGDRAGGQGCWCGMGQLAMQQQARYKQGVRSCCSALHQSPPSQSPHQSSCHGPLAMVLFIAVSPMGPLHRPPRCGSSRAGDAAGPSSAPRLPAGIIHLWLCKGLLQLRRLKCS